MTKRSLGLRFGGSQKFTNFPVVAPVSDAPAQAEPEFLEAVEEDDRDDIQFGVPDTVDAAPVAPEAVPPNPHDAIPMGHFIDDEGMEWIDAVPAFLMRPDRPRSNIR